MTCTTRPSTLALFVALGTSIVGCTESIPQQGQSDATKASATVQPENVRITGTPGSPAATTTIDGRQLPPPDPKFGGVIKDNAAQSKPWWAPRVVPPRAPPTSSSS